MSEKKTIDPNRIKIQEFRLIKGQVDSPFDFKIKNIQSFNFNVNFNTGVNIDEKLIRADLEVDVSTVSTEKTEEARGAYHFVFIFNVEDLSEHAAKTAEGAVDWNPYLANAIAAITYSTSRGILLSRFQGTVLRDFLLPVVDPNALLQKKAVVSG